jgi:hypothetical protein
MKKNLEEMKPKLLKATEDTTEKMGKVKIQKE